jgi:hypothetical protein
MAGGNWVARYSRVADSRRYSAGFVPSKYWLSFCTACRKWSPPGWSTALWIRVMELSRIALRSSAVRCWRRVLLAVEPIFDELPLLLGRTGAVYLPPDPSTEIVGE